jgi:hypothetical protein
MKLIIDVPDCQTVEDLQLHIQHLQEKLHQYSPSSTRNVKMFGEEFGRIRSAEGNSIGIWRIEK